MRRLRVRPRQPGARAASGPALGVLRPLCEELADGPGDTGTRKRGPKLRRMPKGMLRAASGAPGGAHLRSQGKAARLTSASGGFAGPLGALAGPAFLGAPLPSFGECEGRPQTPGADAPRDRGRLYENLCAPARGHLNLAALQIDQP